MSQPSRFRFGCQHNLIRQAILPRPHYTVLSFLLLIFFFSLPGPSPLSQTPAYLLSSGHPLTGRKFLQGACHLPASEGNEKRRERTLTDQEYYKNTRAYSRKRKVLLTERPQQYVCAEDSPKGRHLHAEALPSLLSHLSHWCHTYQIQIKQIFLYYIFIDYLYIY